MDNLSDLLGGVLSDPDAVEKLRETARQLGLGGEPPAAAGHGNADDTPAGGLPARLLPLLGELDREDDMTRLLHALKPYLTGTRLKRAEDAEKMLAVLRLIPLLREKTPLP